MMGMFQLHGSGEDLFQRQKKETLDLQLAIEASP